VPALEAEAEDGEAGLVSISLCYRFDGPARAGILPPHSQNVSDLTLNLSSCHFKIKCVSASMYLAVVAQ